VADVPSNTIPPRHPHFSIWDPWHFIYYKNRGANRWCWKFLWSRKRPLFRHWPARTTK